MESEIMQLPEASWAEFKRLFSAFFSATLGNTVAFDGVVPGELSVVKHYGECATAANVAEKTLACAGFTLITGARIIVKFTVTNTAAKPTLNVNSTGAKPIYYRGAAVPAEYLTANRTYTFIYNGSQYELVGDIVNTIQQGTITLYNKFVISGCVVGKVANSRNIILTETGTSSASGASKFFAGGAIHNLTDGLTAAVPTNSTTSAVTYYACLVKNNFGAYELKVQTSTVGVLPLYKIVVPASNTAANLNSVTITDVRRIETNYTNFYASRPYASVALTTAFSNANYIVELRAESWSGANVGELLAYDLANNGFKIAATGDADNILVRWCATAQ